MKAAVYARKSTEQRVAADSKSVTRQVENGRAFATKRGWSVTDGRVYVDDAVSGAEFDRRPGLQKMLAAAKRGEFSVLVVSEQKTIGREMSETAMVVKQLAQAGVEIWGYLEARSLTPRGSVDKLTSVIQGFADEDQRVKTALRVHEGHRRHAERGHVVGGRLYGYRNVDRFAGEYEHGRPLRSHVEREVLPAEAAVVRRIFKLFAGGLGLKGIAKALNADRVPTPRYTPHGGLTAIAGWTPSTVKAILGREIYHGVLVWNARRKRDDWGQVRVTRRPEAEWVRVPTERLRIVPEKVWAVVEARRRQTAGKTPSGQTGRLVGRPPKGRERSLLAGVASCAQCGGGLVVETSSGPRRGDAYRYYACGRRRHSGTCDNAMRLPAEETDEQVLRAVEEHVLTPERVEAFLVAVERDDSSDRRGQLEREAKDVDRRLARVVQAIEAGGDAPALVARVRELEARRAAIEADRASLEPVPRLAPAVLKSRLAEWRRLLRADVAQARSVLQRVVDGRVAFKPYPEGMGAEFEARTKFSGLFVGVMVPALPVPSFVKPGDRRGWEAIAAEDQTLEARYEDLLERAEAAVRRVEKGGRPWRDSNPRSSP